MRDRLIELIAESENELLMVDPYTTDTFRIENVADHLLAHGVTAQEWISVKDRLPEDDSDVLAYLRIGEEGRIYPANYANGMWFDCIFNTPATDSTTHWMPLPPAPEDAK